MHNLIEVSNLSKSYILSHEGEREKYTALRDVIAKKTKKFFSLDKENINKNKNGEFVKSEEFWALKDVSFNISAGDCVGIIGRNGAGKSTLLKILSRITEPTQGQIKIRGRVASLLEVGTGFHPELTGRENIYLNGAILGMSQAEIKRKFDEIVAFAEVEKFLDTPVKRYSSGMYVRLAFAVAAHLEPEILVIDEVLAVGDAQFQKKCLGKMQDVSKNEGRTVLFVSHNMAAVSSLCNKGIYLKNGSLVDSGNITSIISSYMGDSSSVNGHAWIGNAGDSTVVINRTEVYPTDTENGFHTNTDLIVEIEGEILKPFTGFIIGFNLWSQFEYEIAYILHDDKSDNNSSDEVLPTTFKKRFKIPANTLAEGTYRIQFDIGIHNVKRIVNEECDLIFTLVNINGIGRKYLVGSQKGKSSLIRTDWAI